MFSKHLDQTNFYFIKNVLTFGKSGVGFLSSSLFLAQKISQRAADSQDCEGPEHDGVPLHGPQPDHHLLGVVTAGERLLGHLDIQEGAERLPAFPHVEDQQLGLRDLSPHLEHSETQITDQDFMPSVCLYQCSPLSLVEECRGSALIGREDHSDAGASSLMP